MAWPEATAYSEAVQNPQVAFGDAELQAGQLATNLLGLPLVHVSNFAAVFQLRRPAGPPDWALKCFTRQVHGLRRRYQAIHAHLDGRWLPFMVQFAYQADGVLVQGQRYPLLKMDWVEGLRLDEFLADCLTRPGAKGVLRRLSQMWLKLSVMLRQAEIGHGDLQHGNVMLVPVPGSDALALKLIDYDGMYVPELAAQPPGEIGHPAYQHPLRTSKTGYGPEVDRFSHLVIYTTLQALLAGGRELWQPFYNGDRLLLGSEDFRDPENSMAFRALWESDNQNVRRLTGHLVLAGIDPIEDTPLLGDLVIDTDVLPLTDELQSRVAGILGTSARAHPGFSAAFEAGRGMENPILLRAIRIGTTLVSLAACLLLLLACWQAGRYLLSLISTSAQPGVTSPLLEEDRVVEASVAAAVYDVRIKPPEAVLTASGRGLSIEGEGSHRTVTVASPDGETSVVLLAVLDGYENARLELEPVAGENRELVLDLARIRQPAVYDVHVTPPDALLTGTGEGLSIQGQGSDRRVTVASPDGETRVVLLAVSEGHHDQPMELQPEAGETQQIAIELLRFAQPAVYRITVTPASAELTAAGQGVVVSGVGRDRTITVAAPDGESRIELLASLEGYQDHRVEYQPVAGQTRDITMTLSRSPEPETLAKPSRTFADLPAVVSLPALDAPDALEPTILGAMQITSDDQCFIRMRGGANALGGNRVFAMRNADAGLAERDWEIYLRDAAERQESKIAHLSLNDQSQLVFQWQPEARDDPAAVHLINCALSIYHRRDTHVVMLRQPTKVPGFEIDLKNPATRHTFRLGTLPDIGKIRVEIKSVRGEKHTIEPKSVMNAEKGEAWIRFQAGGGSLLLKVETDLRRELQLAFLPHVQWNPDARPQHLLVRQIEEAKKPLQAAVKHWENLFQQGRAVVHSSAPVQQRMQVQQFLVNYEIELKASQENLAKFVAFEHMLEKFKPQVEVRVFYNADGSEIDLLQARS